MLGYMAFKKLPDSTTTIPSLRTQAQRKEDKTDNSIRDLTCFLCKTALLTSGFIFGEPLSLAERIYSMIALGLGVDVEESSDVPSASTNRHWHR